MQSHKVEKISFNDEYPCPCRRRGRLVPITLTEAFGCDRCQQIFVVEDNGHVLEQLSTTYPYKRSWRWTGQGWMIVRPRLGDNYLPIALAMIFVLVLIAFIAAPHIKSGHSIIALIMVMIVVAVLPALMAWLTYRR